MYGRVAVCHSPISKMRIVLQSMERYVRVRKGFRIQGEWAEFINRLS